MRQLHRWIGLVTALFLLIIAVTGIVLQVQELMQDDDDDDDRPAAVLPADSYDAMFARTLEAIQAAAPKTPAASIALQMSGDIPEGVAIYPGEPGRRITVDARDGKILKDEEYEKESFIRRLHSGEAIGDGGVVLNIVWGLALVVLSVTGIWVYVDLYIRRKRTTGKKGLFW